ncbi:hypothetical protein BO71DRAFT_397820 [Aspergillus ellipticus CBS 707.79]|uniref:C2H2-type domain-containing protein n=1 Tax=Aspergillus ellipticus CBS 707.79 TaxID=1448320 RepID=A0A319E4P5_9EURO|nr:hypothetical protein BO71DRAFT_397820 [Aspergillus ellipticus CBS 707.79]
MDTPTNATVNDASSDNDVPLTNGVPGTDANPSTNSTEEPPSTTPRMFSCDRDGCTRSFIRERDLRRHIRCLHEVRSWF